jgi:hypothetical protein
MFFCNYVQVNLDKTKLIWFFEVAILFCMSEKSWI